MVLPKCALIRAAIVHVTKQQRGASLVQIRKHLEATYEEKVGAKKKKFICSAFKSLIQEGKLMQKGAVYKSTKRRAIARASIPKRRYRRRLRPSRRRRPTRRRHHRRRAHHKIHVRRAHHRKIRARRRGDETPEPPDYTNSVPSVEVPDCPPPGSTPRSSTTSKRN